MLRVPLILVRVVGHCDGRSAVKNYVDAPLCAPVARPDSGQNHDLQLPRQARPRTPKMSVIWRWCLAPAKHEQSHAALSQTLRLLARFSDDPSVDFKKVGQHAHKRKVPPDMFVQSHRIWAIGENRIVITLDVNFARQGAAEIRTCAQGVEHGSKIELGYPAELRPREIVDIDAVNAGIATIRGPHKAPCNRERGDESRLAHLCGSMRDRTA